MKKLLNLLKDKQLQKEFFKFLLIGAIATLIDFGVMYGLSVWWTSLDLDPTLVVVLSSGMGFTISLIFNYFLNIIFVFTENEYGKTFVGFIKFLAISLIGLGIHTLGMYIGYTLLGINEWIVKIILTGIVLIFNFVMRKLFIFNNKRNSKVTNKATDKNENATNIITE